MAKSSNDVIDIDLFQDNLKFIDREFLQTIRSIFSHIVYKPTGNKIEFILMTNDATYAYGKHICSWLSLKHDLTRPQKISILNDMKIIQVISGLDFVTILTDDGHVYLASNDSNWQTNNTCRLINIGNDRFKMIACGYKHLLLLRQDGTVFAMGRNHCGQLTGKYQSSYKTMVNIGLKNIKLITCGKHHSLAVTDTEKVYSWGQNDCGQLGVGDYKKRKMPFLVKFDNSIDNRIKDIVAGYKHSLFLFENGQLWSCGHNGDGQLGLGDQKNRPKPMKIMIEKKIQKAVCSIFNTPTWAYDGGSSYYSWGYNTKNSHCLSPRKLNGQPESFAAASEMILLSPITFGQTTISNVFKFYDSKLAIHSIGDVFNNTDNYDVEFIVRKKSIKAWKCYLKMVSEYYLLMFSNNWKEKNQIMINEYSYDTYYAYLRMLHNGTIRINPQNIDELIDLANCYRDQRLLQYCKTFIRNDLNEQTMNKYHSLIRKYQIKELYDKLAHLCIEKMLPKITDSLLRDNENSLKFLVWFYDQQSFIEK